MCQRTVFNNYTMINITTIHKTKKIAVEIALIHSVITCIFFKCLKNAAHISSVLIKLWVVDMKFLSYIIKIKRKNIYRWNWMANSA